MESKDLEPLPKVLCDAIEGTISIGPGDLTNFCVNGKLIFERVEWKKYCVIDAQYGGLICDNERKAKFGQEDTWYASTMNNHGNVVNKLNADKIDGDVEEVKRQTAKKGKIINA